MRAERKVSLPQPEKSFQESLRKEEWRITQPEATAKCVPGKGVHMTERGIVKELQAVIYNWSYGSSWRMMKDEADVERA